MHITAVRENEGFLVVVDGEPRQVPDLPVSDEFSAAQWDGDLSTKGEAEVEYRDPRTKPNEKDYDLAWIKKVHEAWVDAEPRMVYSTETADPLEITVSDPVPSGYTASEPDVPNPRWENGQWVEGPPEEVSRFQGKAALLDAGLLQQVRDLIEAEGTDEYLKLAWEDAQVFRRESRLIKGIADELGLSDSRVDELFIAAGKIEA